MTALSLFIALIAAPNFYGVPGVVVSYAPIVQHWADVYRVPRWLAMKIMVTESDSYPLAKSRAWHKVKRRWVAGAVLSRGLLQVSIKDETEHARKAGVKAFDWRNPSDSARVGLCYLGALLRYFGDIRPAVAGYNCGRTRAARWFYGGEGLPMETRGYLVKVLGGPL